ncbi:glycosyltransferase [[Clostridium] symbiosum]|uniref:glycosyltransferase n=1 Tax=Clostridium symbiosum TaxID=1512 RepID=UPI001D07E8A1|nr:glycosyltransferase [[Clostridium] symbiosum]MCB6607642.1 glycosyltransferase [[Clostridium] symbiosum]MCB6929319.1 glycosyltransferase [[Clostridium] symbiosum]
MYILIIGRGYPTPKYKTNGIFEYDQAKALAKCGNKVVYIALDLRLFIHRRDYKQKHFVADGVDVELVNIPFGSRPQKVVYPLYIYGMKYILKKIYIKYGYPEIIHSHFPEISYICAKSIQSKRIPFIITEHSSKVHCRNLNKFEKKMLFYAYKKADKVLAVSESLCKVIFEDFHISAVSIPNLVNLDSFNYSERDTHQKNIFISVGNLIELKQMDLLVVTFIKLINKFSDIQLYIFGEGSEREKLESLISSHNVQDNIFLMGLRGREEIAEALKKSGTFILLSRSETFGVAMIEALAAGVPVITTRCGGAEEYINNGINGVFVDPYNVEEVIENCYLDNYKFISSNISEDIKRKFSNIIVSKKILDIYRDVIRENYEYKKEI